MRLIFTNNTGLNNNRYTIGSGVGATNRSNRSALKHRAYINPYSSNKVNCNITQAYINTLTGATTLNSGTFTLCEDLTIPTNIYFTTSGAVTFDGAGHTITLASEGSNWSGLFRSNGFTVKNLTMGGVANLIRDAGYFFDENIKYGAAINCTNNLDFDVNNAGGIFGASAGYDGGSVSAISCINNGSISGTLGGGIFGQHAGINGGYAAATGCINNGIINTQNSGGIFGEGAGAKTGIATAIDCINNGTLDYYENIGGIFGGNAGGTDGVTLDGGTATAINCKNYGEVSGGGIFGGNAGPRGIATATNCENRGLITGANAGGIFALSAGANVGEAIATSCINYMEVSGAGAGGIYGSGACGTNGIATATTCINNGAISGENTGGIFGLNAGGLTASFVATATSCTNNGTVSGSNAGAIFGPRVPPENHYIVVN